MKQTRKLGQVGNTLVNRNRIINLILSQFFAPKVYFYKNHLFKNKKSA